MFWVEVVMTDKGSQGGNVQELVDNPGAPYKDLKPCPCVLVQHSAASSIYVSNYEEKTYASFPNCRYNPVAGFQFGGASTWRNSQPPLEVAPPAVLPQPPQKGPAGHHETGNLAVFLNNRGDVTAYTSSGHKLWQARCCLTCLCEEVPLIIITTGVLITVTIIIRIVTTTTALPANARYLVGVS